MRIVRRATSILAVSVIGTLLIVAGLVMLVTPGPGLLAIVAGLAVWSREFRWARRLLHRAKARLTEARARRRGEHVQTIVLPDADEDTPADPPSRVA